MAAVSESQPPAAATAGRRDTHTVTRTHGFIKPKETRKRINSIKLAI